MTDVACLGRVRRPSRAGFVRSPALAATPILECAFDGRGVPGPTGSVGPYYGEMGTRGEKA